MASLTKCWHCSAFYLLLGCTGRSEDYACCTKESPCQHGGGDCDMDEECAGDLVCGDTNCQDFHSAAISYNDCCTNNTQASKLKLT